MFRKRKACASPKLIHYYNKFAYFVHFHASMRLSRMRTTQHSVIISIIINPKRIGALFAVLNH